MQKVPSLLVEGQLAVGAATSTGHHRDVVVLAEPGLLHESRDLRLDVGDTYAWSLSVDLVQLFELERLDDTGPAYVRLTVVQNEVVGEAVALLSAEEARAFARMLTTMARDLDDADRLRGSVVRRPRTRTVLLPVPAPACLAFDAKRGWHLLTAPPDWWLEEQEALLLEDEEGCATAIGERQSCSAPAWLGRRALWRSPSLP